MELAGLFGVVALLFIVVVDTHEFPEAEIPVGVAAPVGPAIVEYTNCNVAVSASIAPDPPVPDEYRIVSEQVTEESVAIFREATYAVEVAQTTADSGLSQVPIIAYDFPPTRQQKPVPEIYVFVIVA